MKKAWVVEIDNVLTVRDVVKENPFNLFLPEIAQHYVVDVPDYVENGAIFDNIKQEWVNIEIPIPETVKTSEIIQAKDLKLKFTPEQIKQIVQLSETNNTIDYFFREISSRLIITVKPDEILLIEALDYLKQYGVLSQEEIDRIMAGL